MIRPCHPKLPDRALGIIHQNDQAVAFKKKKTNTTLSEDSHYSTSGGKILSGADSNYKISLQG